MRKVHVRVFKNRDWIQFNAVFHDWGVSYEEFSSGPGNYSTAIVEDDQGVVHNVPAESVTFLDPILFTPTT